MVEVDIYSLPRCKQCDNAKCFIKNYQGELKVSDRGFLSNYPDLIASQRIQQAPYIAIRHLGSGNTYNLTGFDQEKLEYALSDGDDQAW